MEVISLNILKNTKRSFLVNLKMNLAQFEEILLKASCILKPYYIFENFFRNLKSKISWTKYYTKSLKLNLHDSFSLNLVILSTWNCDLVSSSSGVSFGFSSVFLSNGDVNLSDRFFLLTSASSNDKPKLAASRKNLFWYNFYKFQ